MIIHTTQT